MRLIVLGVCLFAAACSGKALNSPTSPTNASLGPAQTAARGGTALPFRGSFTTVIDVPPPSAHATAEGTATQLGRFTGTSQLTSIPTVRGRGHSTSLRRMGTSCLAQLLVKVSSYHQITPGLRTLRRSRTEPVGLRGPLERLRWSSSTLSISRPEARSTGDGNIRRGDQLEQVKDAFWPCGPIRWPTTVGNGRPTKRHRG